MSTTTLTYALCALLAVTACGGTGDDAMNPSDTTSATSGTTASGPDAEMQAVLDALAALEPKPIPTLTAAEARQQPTPADAVKRVLEAQGKPTTPDTTVATVDRTIPGAAGSIPARVYTPKGVTGPMPVVVYFHGGGWVIGDKEVYDGGARGIAKHAQAIVVSVDYRRGPENKFPAAHDDAFAAYQWVRANAASLGGDAARIHLAGESAGGNLAVATAMAARDGNVPLPVTVLSVYPIAGGDTTTASYQEHADAKPLNRPMMSSKLD